MRIPTAVRAGETLTTTLMWTAQATPDADYTAFLHLLDSSGEFVTGHDQAPAGDRFPTRYWQAGDRIVSEAAMSIPGDVTPGEYALWVGLYATASEGQSRLPVTGPGDAAVANDMVRLGAVTVVGE